MMRIETVRVRNIATSYHDYIYYIDMIILIALIAVIHVFVWPIRVPAVFLNMVSATMRLKPAPMLC